MEMTQLLTHHHTDVLCICVFRAIIQGFLYDSVHTRLMLFGQLVGNILFHYPTSIPVRLETSRPCHSSAATRPRSSNIEGRRSRAIFRTSLTQFSASILMFRRPSRKTLSSSDVPAKFSTSTSRALKDCPTSS